MERKGNTLSGLDVLLTEEIDSLRGKRVGIMCNHTAVTRDLIHITDALHTAGANLTALFGPEHGVRGDAADGDQLEDAIDPKLGIPAFSLYLANQSPTPEMLSHVDVILCDIQDVGARFYTFPYTMANVMRACGEHGVEVWVLDRPNPISGLCWEGNILDPEFSSLVGMFATPIRHGFTTGELAMLFRDRFGVQCDLRVVKMQNWTRDMWYDDTGLPWLIPSLNVPTLDTAIVYTGTCYFEGTNVAEARGTTRPFELFGAPWIDAQALRREMISYGLPGIAYREAYFTPFDRKYKGEPCSGLQFYVTDRNAFKPVITGLMAVYAVSKLHPDKFEFLPPQCDPRGLFVLHSGGFEIRRAIEAGTPPIELEQKWQPDLDKFLAETKSCLLY